MFSSLTRRAIAFIIAVILAIVAAVAVYSVLQGVEEEAAEEADAVIGYVATQRIEPGTLADTAIEQGVIEEREIPRSLVAEQAVTDLSQIRGRTVQETILPGDQIVSDRFAVPGESVQVLTIPPDHEAMSVQVGIVPGVAGFPRAGDSISVIVYISVPDPTAPATVVEDAETGEQTTQEGSQQRAQYVVQDAEVLAVGRRVEPTEEDPDGGTTGVTESVLLTLAVTPDEAEQLTFATLTGQLYLTLLPEDETETEPAVTPGRTADNLFEETP